MSAAVDTLARTHLDTAVPATAHRARSVHSGPRDWIGVPVFTASLGPTIMAGPAPSHSLAAAGRIDPARRAAVQRAATPLILR